MESANTEKYEHPSITVLGRVEDLTQANVTGDFLDDDFPQNTPRGDLTFS